MKRVKRAMLVAAIVLVLTPGLLKAEDKSLAELSIQLDDAMADVRTTSESLDALGQQFRAKQSEKEKLLDRLGKVQEQQNELFNQVIRSRPPTASLRERRAVLNAFPAIAVNADADIKQVDSLVKDFDDIASQTRAAVMALESVRIQILGHETSDAHWKSRRGNATEQELAESLTVGIGDTLEWRVTEGTHGVAFRNGADAKRALNVVEGLELQQHDFSPPIEATHNRGMGASAADNGGLLLKMIVQMPSDVSQVEFFCTKHEQVPGITLKIANGRGLIYQLEQLATQFEDELKELPQQNPSRDSKEDQAKLRAARQVLERARRRVALVNWIDAAAGSVEELGESRDRSLRNRGSAVQQLHAVATTDAELAGDARRLMLEIPAVAEAKLIELFQQPDASSRTRVAIVRSLATTGEPAVAQLVQWAGHEDPEVRTWAMQGLGSIVSRGVKKPNDLIAGLQALLESPDEFVRSKAIEIVRELAGDSVLPAPQPAAAPASPATTSPAAAGASGGGGVINANRTTGNS